MMNRNMYLRAVILSAALIPAGTALLFCDTGTASTPSKAILNSIRPGLTLDKGGLLDPDRFSMRQQYLMNFSSTGGTGGLMGMYLNTMEYRFNAPLIMRLKVAYQSQTGMLFGRKDTGTAGFSNNQQGRMFVPAFDIVYKPWKNTTFTISYRDYTGMNTMNSSRYGSYGYRNPYGSPYGYGLDYGIDRDMYRMLYGWDALDRRVAGR